MVNNYLKNYPVRFNKGELSRWAMPNEVRLHIRTRLNFDYLSILKCFCFMFMSVFDLWLHVLSQIWPFLSKICFPTFLFWRSLQKHGEVLDVWFSSIEITSNCRKCIFQESGWSMFVKSGYVHCFGHRVGVKENFGDNVLWIRTCWHEVCHNNDKNTSRIRRIWLICDGGDKFLRSAPVTVGTFYLQVLICKAALLVLYWIHDSSYLHG